MIHQNIGGETTNRPSNNLAEPEEIGEICIDSETTSLDPHQADLVGISISTKIGHACYIPVGHKKGNNLDETNVIKPINDVIYDVKYGRNRWNV